MALRGQGECINTEQRWLLMYGIHYWVLQLSILPFLHFLSRNASHKTKELCFRITILNCTCIHRANAVPYDALMSTPVHKVSYFHRQSRRWRETQKEQKKNKKKHREWKEYIVMSLLLWLTSVKRIKVCVHYASINPTTQFTVGQTALIAKQAQPMLMNRVECTD